MKKYNYILLIIFLCSCTSTQKALTEEKKTALAAALSFEYCLQADKKYTADNFVKAVQQSSRQAFIIDAFFSTGKRWSPEQIKLMKKSGKTILCYLSIGEAESYRPYWQKSWKKNPPAFLLKENPDWAGNYRVKYWDKQWQKLILTEIERIAAQGFDGLYLDIVDAFEGFEEVKGKYVDHRKNPETANSYRQDMVNWVTTLSKHVRQQQKNFFIVLQNGSQLLADPAYLKLIDGIGIEDLYSRGKKLQSKGHTKYILSFLKKMKDKKKPVLVVEYSPEKLQKNIRQKVIQEGFNLLFTKRDLSILNSD